MIVSPEQLDWMQPPTVPDDPKFSWWNQLREVPCAWVSSRGESERFLYYDGPTAAEPPVIVELAREKLTTVYAKAKVSEAVQDSLPFVPLSVLRVNLQNRCGLYVRVDPSTLDPSGCVVDVPAATDLSKEPMLHGDTLISRFHSLLIEAGLTDAEASGLVDCWRPQFFQTPGSRFILLMSAYDYDRLCPIRIDPPPTELVRVGLVLTEFEVVQ